MLSFIFYVIIKRKRGFCCKTAVDFYKNFKVVKFYCGSRVPFSFPLACVCLDFLRKSSGLRSAPMACFRTGVFCLRAMGKFRADSRGSRYEGFAGKNWQGRFMENSGRLLRQRPADSIWDFTALKW